LYPTNSREAERVGMNGVHGGALTLSLASLGEFMSD
jgi:hypothetical protein